MLRVLQADTRVLGLALALLVTGAAEAQNRKLPQPVPVAPGEHGAAPSDAILLFNGKDTSGLLRENGSPTGCEAKGGELVCATGSGDVFTTEKYLSAQIHVEFNLPSMPDQKGQLKGNSGVFLHGRYEIQVLDSFENPTYADGALGALYGQAPPLVNAARKPGEWQSFDILFRAPKCGPGGELLDKATVTVILNGVLVQDAVAINKTVAESCQPGPLRLQDHSGFPGAPHTVIRFRNLWMRKLN